MKPTLLVCLFFASFVVSAKEFESPFIEPDSVVENVNLENTSKLFFHIRYQHEEQFIRLDYSLDGSEAVHIFADFGPLELEVNEGTHELQFYLTSDFHEEYVMVAVEAGKNYYYTVQFRTSEIRIMSEKPVIYLYPEEQQEVHVEVVPRGELTFTYPEYDMGWNVLAAPDGTLEVDGATYNYLFWESSEKMKVSEMNTNKGFVVNGVVIADFLNEKLRYAGLNSKERADFITFWAPRMMQHQDVFVQFHFNEECDRFANLSVHPEPDQIYRIYILWQPLDQLLMEPEPQEIQRLDRKGFTVVEWGGQEIPKSVLVE